MFADGFSSETPWFGELRRLEQELDALFGGNTPWSGGIRSLPAGTFPAINVGSTDGKVTVYVMAPGIEPGSLDIILQQNVLSISGTRQIPIEPEATYYRQERYSGDFRRVVTLPDDVDPDRVDAVYRDGIVQISVQRRESAKPRQIAIQ